MTGPDHGHTRCFSALLSKVELARTGYAVCAGRGTRRPLVPTSTLNRRVRGGGTLLIGAPGLHQVGAYHRRVGLSTSTMKRSCQPPMASAGSTASAIGATASVRTARDHPRLTTGRNGDGLRTSRWTRSSTPTAEAANAQLLMGTSESAVSACAREMSPTCRRALSSARSSTSRRVCA